ncbi:MAG TPA: hypothetical protein VFO76_06635, partial [Candidatus Kapabacteria bacterium]|nr:hypothetical protein [Candidatus Kapabacteria bacterium]
MKKSSVPCNSRNFDMTVCFAKVISYCLDVILFAAFFLVSDKLFAQDVEIDNITEYNQMNIFSAMDDARFGSSPMINLTMGCLAANGYGQWTMSSNTGTYSDVSTTGSWKFSPDQTPLVATQTWNQASGWFLLGNMIGQPSLDYDPLDDVNHPGCQPPGIVSGGQFQGAFPSPYKPKAVANLVGSVRYVWPSGTRTSFVVQGFNDDRGPDAARQQINISLNGFPNPVLNRQIIKKSIYLYPTVPTLGLITGTISTTGDHTVNNTEGDLRDVFDVACDAKYLYIVWTSVANLPAGVTQEIWATAIDLSSGNPVTGFPIVVSLPSGSGRRPTVACDVRNSPGSPTFDVAYLDLTSGKVVLQEFVGTAVNGTHQVSLTKSFHDPFSSGTSDHTYTTALHARVLVSSVAGSSTPMHCVYVITNDKDLILYKPITWDFPVPDIAQYVDGIFTNNPSAPRPYPSPISGSSTNASVVDAHIVAFANPYDADPSATYNQFHCLYQLSITKPSSVVIKPLIIIRGCDNNFGNSGSPETRLLINRGVGGGISSSDPDAGYVAAINQMGIHVHWRVSSTGIHNYARLLRYFDEPIEENTLVTNDTYIKDGSGHGGTPGARLVGGRKLTVWTDPNYGASESNANSGLYLQSPSVTLLAGT